MSMLKSKTWLRVFRMRGELPEDLAERLKKNAVGDMAHVRTEPAYFWAAHRHMADGAITEDSIRLGGYRVFQLVRAVRRVSPSLLKTEVAAQVEARLKDTGLPFIGNKDLQEIREAVRDALAAKAQLSLSAHLVVICGRHVFTDAVSESAASEIGAQFWSASGVKLDRCDWLLLGMDAKVDVGGIRPLSFSVWRGHDQATDNIGAEFLTWLWWGSQGDQVEEFGLNNAHGAIEIGVRGPLHLESEESMATEAKFSGDRAPLSPDVAAALRDGKKLTKCRLSVVIAGEVYQGVFNATDGTWTSLEVPPAPADLNRAEAFEHRVLRVERLAVEVMPALFKRFVGQRASDGGKLVESIREWVRGMGEG